MKSKRKIILLFGILFLISCANFDSEHVQVVTLPDIDISGSPNGIVPLPENTPAVFTNLFSKYTKIIAPNGKPIHFLAQDAWSDDKILRARNIMEHILTDFPGSEYGNDKSIVANTMADRKATMTLFNTSVAAREAREGPFRGGTDLFTQSLWANEITVVGSEDYMNHITHNAAHEEIFHLVHGAGIIPAIPQYNKEIMVTMVRAIDEIEWPHKGVPNDNPPGWHFEYITQRLDIYLGIWNIQPKVWEGRELQPGEMPEGTAHWGQSQANSRGELRELDPAGYELVEKFFHPYITYTPQLPMDFEGTFSIEFDESLVYTYKSQYLKNVTLRGSNDANLTGNAYDNVLTGNAGNNILKGCAGDDQLYGGDGDDTAVFSGEHIDYSITNNDGYVTVKDKRVKRDGTDTLTNIEFLQFSNRKVTL